MLPKKWNSNISPTEAVTVSGLKVKPLCPALMTMVLAVAVAAIAAIRLIDECIVLLDLRGTVIIVRNPSVLYYFVSET